MRMAMFGTPFRVYPDTAPLTALLHGDWLQTLASSTAWLEALLPNAPALARGSFLAALSGLIVVGMLACMRRREFRRPWLALGAAALLSVGMLLPHLSVLAPNGEEGGSSTQPRHYLHCSSRSRYGGRFARIARA